MWFHSPGKPIATCRETTCGKCPIRETLHCHFRPGDLVYFYTLSIPGFLLGGWGIAAHRPWLLVPWIAVIVGYFLFAEIRVMCSHCPHYAQEGEFLRCWANYGAPKIWRYRPGPMNGIEKSVFFAGAMLIWGFPFPSLVGGGQWLLTLLYILSTAAFFATLKKYLCTRCMNFACPLNGVPDGLRRQFFQRNPEVGRAWGIADPPRPGNGSEGDA